MPSRKLFNALNDFCLHSQAGEEGLPEFFHLLRGWVDGEHGAFFHTDSSGKLCGAYHEVQQHASQAAEFIRRARDGSDAQRPHDPPSVESLFRQPVPLQLMSFDSPARRESALYRDIISRIDGVHVLRVGLRSQHRPLGVLALVRGRHHRNFRDAEMQRFLETGSALTRMLNVQSSIRGERMLSAEGSLLLAANGEPLHACTQGERLWYQLHSQRVGASHQPDYSSLLQSLAAEAMRQPSRMATRTISNLWGEFELSANRLSSLKANGSDIVQLRLRLFTLTRVFQLQQMQRNNLSSMQKRVALGLLRRRTQSQIAQELGIGVETVISHIRAVYTRCNVSGRDELAQLFAAPAAGISAPSIATLN